MEHPTADTERVGTHRIPGQTVPGGLTVYPLPRGPVDQTLLWVDWEQPLPPALLLHPTPPPLPEDPDPQEREWIERVLRQLEPGPRPPPLQHPGLYRGLAESRPWHWSTGLEGGWTLHPGYLGAQVAGHGGELGVGEVLRCLAETSAGVVQGYPELQTLDSRRPWGRPGCSGLGAVIYEPYARPEVTSALLWYLGGLLYPASIPPPLPTPVDLQTAEETRTLWRDLCAQLEYHAAEAAYLINAVASVGEGSLLTMAVGEGPQTVWVWWRGLWPTLEETWTAAGEWLSRQPGRAGVICRRHWDAYVADPHRLLPVPLGAQVAAYREVEAAVVELVSALYDPLPDPDPPLYPDPRPDRYTGAPYAETTYYSRLHAQLIPAPIPPPDPLPPSRYSLPPEYHHPYPGAPLEVDPEAPLRPPRRRTARRWWSVTHRWARDRPDEPPLLGPHPGLWELPRSEARRWWREATDLLPPDVRDTLVLPPPPPSLLEERRQWGQLANHLLTLDPLWIRHAPCPLPPTLLLRLLQREGTPTTQLALQRGGDPTLPPSPLPPPALPLRRQKASWSRAPLPFWIRRAELVRGGEVIETISGPWSAWWSNRAPRNPGLCPLHFRSLRGGLTADSLRIYWTEDWLASGTGERRGERVSAEVWCRRRSSEGGQPAPPWLAVSVAEEGTIDLPDWAERGVLLPVLSPHLPSTARTSSSLPDLQALLSTVWRTDPNPDPIWAQIAQVPVIGPPSLADWWTAHLWSRIPHRPEWIQQWSADDLGRVVGEDLPGWWSTLLQWYGYPETPLPPPRDSVPGWEWVWALLQRGGLDPQTPGLWEAVQTLTRHWQELETEEIPPPEWQASQGWIEVPGPLRSIWWRRASEEERTLAVRGSGTLCLWGAES